MAFVLGVSQLSEAQVITCVPCDMLGMSVNVGSQETMINIYHSGQYMTHPQVRKYFYVGVYRPTRKHSTSRDFIDESTISFGHSWSLSDTINVTVHFVNDSANLDNWYINQGLPTNGNSINCLFEDQIYWETGDPTPWGSWTFIHNNPGVDLNAPTGIGSLVLDEKKLIKTLDALGREVNHTTNQILFYIYDDGSVEKRFIVE